jgi:hypothetical protein
MGVDLIVDTDVIVGASYEFSNAIATEEGTCYTFQLDCGSGTTSDDMTFCSPSFTGEGSG